MCGLPAREMVGLVTRVGALVALVSAFAFALPSPAAAAGNSVDFNGDHMTDLGAIFRSRPAQAPLWFAPNGGGAFQTYLGAPGDIPVPGDYDGDGKTDAVIFRPSTGLWFGVQTGGSGIVVQTQFGQAGDIPIPDDYDGDGKTDPAITRPSAYGDCVALLSGGGIKQDFCSAETYVTLHGDYDGDGKADWGSYRPPRNLPFQNIGVWQVRLSSSAASRYEVDFGEVGDILVPGDYNGDGKMDAAIFRPSTGLWYAPFTDISGPGGPPTAYFQTFLGQAGDIPVPGYYDNDAIIDPAIFRPSTGMWFALLSGGGVARVDGLGSAADVPLQVGMAIAGP
jgi:hypothetical protein